MYSEEPIIQLYSNAIAWGLAENGRPCAAESDRTLPMKHAAALGGVSNFPRACIRASPRPAADGGGDQPRRLSRLCFGRSKAPDPTLRQLIRDGVSARI